MLCKERIGLGGVTSRYKRIANSLKPRRGGHPLTPLPPAIIVNPRSVRRQSGAFVGNELDSGE
jgi:hypothetical protein